MKKIIADIKAVKNRDPAVRGCMSWVEILTCYSGLHAVIAHRFNHFIFRKLHLTLIPRLISQIVRFFTGVEIHPGAEIGGGFFIDHGMGVVIGETTEIEENVTIYQGVTLGGTGKDIGKRHPTIKSDTVIGAGAKVLGNIIIGEGVNIGSGSVVIHDVPDHATVVGVPGRVVRHKGEVVPWLKLDHTDLPDPISENLVQIQNEINKIEDHIRCYRENCKLRLLDDSDPKKCDVECIFDKDS